MNENNRKPSKMGFIIGIIGFIAGVFLVFSGQTLIGLAGSIASLGIAIKGYKDLKSQ